jgi:tRNA nucleotidyltransferase (CCA-adding enzyme)
MALGKTSKDFDIEVYGLEAPIIEEIAKTHGNVSGVGKAFEVLKMFLGEGMYLDISLPRRDSKIGKGHKGSHVEGDPRMSIEEAAKRRDFTINSMAFDPLTNELFDPYGGRHDLETHTLRATDPEKFKEDPLRVLRALQFAARFNMEIDEKTKATIREIIPELKELPGERLGSEWAKLLLKAESPSIGLRQGMELGIFRELHPEFADLPNTPQDKKWHPEGDAWIHTLQTVDAAASIIRREGFSLDTESRDSNKALGIMLAALCHDLGKTTTTKIESGGKITSYGHEATGVAPTKKFLTKIRLDYATRDRIIRLVHHHLYPILWHKNEAERGQIIRDKTIRKLASDMKPSNIRELIMVAEADQNGRSEDGRVAISEEFLPGEWLLKKARKIGVEEGPAVPPTRGRDFIDLGYEEGPEIGQLVQLSEELRDEHFDRDRVLEELRPIKDVRQAIKHLEAILELNKHD